MRKRIMSVVMVLCLSVSFVLVMPTLASAATGGDIVAEAEKWRQANSPYGNSNGSGGYGTSVDCSGLVMQVYKKFGYNLEWSTSSQSKAGTYVDKSALQPGDIVCFSYSNGNISHVGIYVGNDKMIHAPGTGKYVQYGNYISTWTYSNAGCRLEYGRRIISTGSNPKGVVDECVGDRNSITIKGWAFDPDNTNTSLLIHIYIGDIKNSNAEWHEIVANHYREDVNKVHGISGNHGFSATITTEKVGVQEVNIYACNVGGGTNIRIGSATVNIDYEREEPVISEVKVSDVSETGYTITCRVADNSCIDRVMFPTWTTHNDQDDLKWYRGTVKGDRASIRINTSDHNNEHGFYTTHIYAYDIYGNTAFDNINDIYIPIEASQKKKVIYGNSEYILFRTDNTLKWHEAKLYCERIGGHLATITTEGENNAIISLIEDETNVGYYLGGTDESAENVWGWINGEEWGYSNWNVGEPNNNNHKPTNSEENYLCINTALDNYTWNDIDNAPEYDYGFICEIELPYLTSVVTQKNDTVAVNTNLYNTLAPCDIIIIGYKDNKLITMQNIPYCGESITGTLEGVIDEIKVMVWDNLSSQKPMCEAEVIPKSKWIT